MSEPETNNSDSDLAEQGDECAEAEGSHHSAEAIENEPENIADDAAPLRESHDNNSSGGDEHDKLTSPDEAASDSAEPAHTPAGSATGGGFPDYLRGLVGAGAIEIEELNEEIDHRVAYIQIEGESGKDAYIPLAYLAPDCIAQIRRRVGSGHVTGYIETAKDSADERFFALVIPADPNQQEAPPETPLERRLSAIEDFMGGGGQQGDRRTDADVIEAIADQQVRIAKAYKKIESTKPAPTAPVYIEREEEKSGIDIGAIVAPLVQPLVEKILPVIVQAVVGRVAGGAAAGVIDTTLGGE